MFFFNINFYIIINRQISIFITISFVMPSQLSILFIILSRPVQSAALPLENDLEATVYQRNHDQGLNMLKLMISALLLSANFTMQFVTFFYSSGPYQIGVRHFFCLSIYCTRIELQHCFMKHSNIILKYFIKNMIFFCP